MQINVFVTVNVGAEGEVLAVGRKFAAANLPFVVREPSNLLRKQVSALCSSNPDVQKANVLVSVGGIRRDKDGLGVLHTEQCEIIRVIALLAFMRREQRALSRGDVGDEDIRIRAF